MNKKVIWIIVLVIIILIFLGGAGVVTAYFLGKKVVNTPTPTPTPSTSASAKASLLSGDVKASHCLKNPNGGTGNITIADIAHYSQVSSPITFSGTANVFEGSFMVRIIDCEGNKTINEAVVQASAGDMGVSNPYTETITYPASYAGHYAYIEAYDLSAMDGSVQDLIQVPVYLK